MVNQKYVVNMSTGACWHFSNFGRLLLHMTLKIQFVPNKQSKISYLCLAAGEI